MKKIIHEKLSYKLVGLCFRAQKELGRFCREKQYAEGLENILKESQTSYKREFNPAKENKKLTDGNRFDFLIENEIILEIKAKPFITKEDYYQINRYLELSGIELALIVNFRNKYLKPKRILNAKLYHAHSGHSDE